MSIILFVVGAGIFLVGSIKLGDFYAEGMRVRVAGAVLCVPLIMSQLLYTLAAVLTDGSSGAAGFVAFLELVGMGAAAGVAYWLVMLESGRVAPPASTRRQNYTRPSSRSEGEKSDDSSSKREHPLSKMLSQFGDDEEQKGEERQQTGDKRRQSPTRPPRRQRDYPMVMTTTEAASYLNITEDALLELIESGKIAASRINYRYRISRTVLDEFIEAQE